MQYAIVTKSELGDRWDAPFHIARENLKLRTEQLEATILRKDAIARLSALPSHALRDLDILCRGNQRGSLNPSQITKAIREYPFLALAIIENDRRSAVERIRETIIRNEKALDDLLSITQPTVSGVDLVQHVDQEVEAGHEKPRSGFAYALVDAARYDDEHGEGYGYAILPEEADETQVGYLNDMWIANASGILHPGYCDCPIPILVEDIDLERARRVEIDLPTPRSAFEGGFFR